MLYNKVVVEEPRGLLRNMGIAYQKIEISPKTVYLSLASS